MSNRYLALCGRHLMASINRRLATEAFTVRPIKESRTTCDLCIETGNGGARATHTIADCLVR